MTIAELIKQYLQCNGYDGLVSRDCSCKLDDLFLCGEANNCKAGKRCNGNNEVCEDRECWIKKCLYSDSESPTVLEIIHLALKGRKIYNDGCSCDSDYGECYFLDCKIRGINE